MRSDVVALTQQLVAIESVNPALVPGGAGETAIARFIADWLGARGFAVELIGPDERPSVIGIRPGSGGGRALLLNGHIDTVTLAGYNGDPLDPRIRDERLYGRGSYDMKGGVAAMLVAAVEAAARPLRGAVVVTCVADEEQASLGTQAVLERVRADGAIVTEPTEQAIVTAHKGFVWATVAAHGVAAHGSRPHLGVDAIAKIGPVLVALAELDAALRAGPCHPLLGTGSVHASLIAGGEERSSYPARCVLDLERRTIPGETAADLRRELEAIVAACAGRDPQFRANVELGLVREPFETAPGAAILEALQSSATAVLGAAPPVEGASYWADAALIQARGIPTVMFGPTGAGAHAATEYVETRSLEQVAAVLERTITQFCA